MDIQELTAMLTEGLPADQVAIVKAAIERDAVKTKAAGLRQQKEYEEIQTKAAKLQTELDGEGGKPGTKAYQRWYEENYKNIDALQKQNKAYVDKYGTLEAPTAQQQQAAPNKTLSDQEIQQIVDRRIQEGYAPRWSDLLTSTGGIIQKHFLAGRKNPIDFEAVGKLAEKYNGNMTQAYEEWDKPEREKTEKAATEAEIDRRVKERMQAAGASSNFPAGADFTPGSLTSRPKAEVEKYDKTTMLNDLAKTWAGGTQ